MNGKPYGYLRLKDAKFFHEVELNDERLLQLGFLPMYTKDQKPTDDNCNLSLIQKVAIVAHYGGLLDMDEAEALILIRKLTTGQCGYNQPPIEIRKLLRLIAAKSGDV